jgi:hypothetical protein
VVGKRELGLTLGSRRSWVHFRLKGIDIMMFRWYGHIMKWVEEGVGNKSMKYICILIFKTKIIL